MSKLPTGYRVQDGCQNCKHMFTDYSYDGRHQHLCVFRQNAPFEPAAKCKKYERAKK